MLTGDMVQDNFIYNDIVYKKHFKQEYLLSSLLNNSYAVDL